MSDGSPSPAPRVRILDLSGGAEDGIVEEVGGFADLDHAEAFARAYVRDSIERCREAGGVDVLLAWAAWGEDAEIVGAGDAVWTSGAELAGFAESPADPEERDWRSIDPRARPADPG